MSKRTPEGCTDPISELLGSYELGLLPRKERARVEHHLLTCEHCCEDLWSTAPAVERVLDASEGSDVSEPAPAPRLQRRWWHAAAAAVGLAVLVLPFALRDDGDSLRGGDTPVILLAPLGEIPQLREVDWVPVSEAERYEIRVFSPDGSLLWRSTATAPPVLLPDDVTARARPRGGTYSWLVEAIGPEGETWRSPRTPFTITGP